MKKTYHICLSAGDEVLCRSEEDYAYCFNTFSLAINETGSSLLADSVMSTHLHGCVRTYDPYELITRQKYSYSRYMNRKYGRHGALIEENAFVLELNGLYHTLAAMDYTFRNSLHHGVSPTPFAYRHSSAGVIFKKELGRDFIPELLPASKQHRFLPSRTKCPEGYRMDKSGLILREDVVDVADVEHMYGTARSFLYHMNRLSSEEWLREQEKDENGSRLITLEVIEQPVRHQSIGDMLNNEHGRNDYRRMGDLELCTLIDKEILPSMGKESVYTLTVAEKQELARYIRATYHLPAEQIRRCVAMSYNQ